MCDNTDCKNLDMFEYKVQLREEFGSDIVIWCTSCIARDYGMIDHILDHVITKNKTSKTITETQLDHINTICDIVLQMIEKNYKYYLSDDNIDALCCNMEIIQEIVKKVKSK